jgi:hypothetical protein
MDREAFRTELATRMLPFVSGLETYLSIPGVEEPYGFARMRQSLTRTADYYAVALQEPDLAENAAYALAVALFAGEHPPLDFWTGEVGPAIARAVGYPLQVAPRNAAAVILKISRQRVHELVTLDVLKVGDLANGATDPRVRQGITAASIRARLREMATT